MKNDNISIWYGIKIQSQKNNDICDTQYTKWNWNVENQMETIQAHRQSFKWLNGYNTTRYGFNGIWGGRSNHHFPYNTGQRNALYLFSDGWVLCNGITRCEVCAFYKEHDKRSSWHDVWRRFIANIIFRCFLNDWRW